MKTKRKPARKAQSPKPPQFSGWRTLRLFEAPVEGDRYTYGPESFTSPTDMLMVDTYGCICLGRPMEQSRDDWNSTGSKPFPGVVYRQIK